ncbi:MAG: DUF368 domain-containing protein [Nanoarchaeota archaeon]
MNKNYLKVYLKGFAMGTCDVIPGISGGTIAFITGIYEKFISSIKNLTNKDFFYMNLKLFKGDFKNFKKDFFKLNIDFLLILFLGIFSAIFLISKLILYLLEYYQSLILSFFVGLIFASTIFIKKELKNYSFNNYLIGFIGFLIGLSFIFFNTTNLSSASLIYITFGGFLAISAMFLPGISGSFILYILGLYNIVYGALHNIIKEYKIILSFAIGAILGAITISRVIDYLFKKDKCKTLFFLLGLVLGALSTPIKTIILSTNFNIINTLLIVLFMILGYLIVIIIE